MKGCPVLHELAVREDYDPEHEQALHLSGGDYDIGAIRDCAANCVAGERLARAMKILQIVCRESITFNPQTLRWDVSEFMGPALASACSLLRELEGKT